MGDKSRLRRAAAWLIVFGLMVGALMVTPAGAHVGGTVGHLWQKHIRPLALRTFYTKRQSNVRFINVGEKASNADKLDGMDSAGFAEAGHDHDADYQQKYAQTIVVSPVGTAAQNGVALLNIVDAITDATLTNRYLVKIEPGTYNLGEGVLTMKQFVDIEGSGELQTIITGRGFDGDTAEDARIVGALNTELRFLTVSSSAAVGDNYATAIAISTQTNLTHVTVRVVNGAVSNVGVRVLEGFPVMRDIWVQVSAPDGSEAVGILSLRNPYLAGSLVQASHVGGGSSKAIKVEAHTFNIDNSVLIGGTNTVVADPAGDVQIGASRLQGGAVNAGGTGTIKCAQSYDAVYNELSSTCT